MKPLTASDLQMGCAGQSCKRCVAFVARCVLGSFRFHPIPMHCMISLCQGCILQNANVKRTSRTKRWTEIRLSNTSFVLMCSSVADSKFSLSGYRILDVSYPHSDSLAHSFVLVVSCCSAFHISIGNFLHERTAKPATASFQSSS